MHAASMYDRVTPTKAVAIVIILLRGLWGFVLPALTEFEQQLLEIFVSLSRRERGFG